MDKLIDALNQHGLIPEEVILDGEIHRCKTTSSKKKNGWYVGNTIRGKIACYFGDWAQGTKQKFADDLVTEEEKKLFDTITVKRQEFQVKQNKVAAIAAARCVEGMPLAQLDHPYIKIKGIPVCGALGANDLIYLPAKNNKGEIVGYQTINKLGEKRFLAGMAKKGSCFIINGDDSVVCICEGYATGATINYATGYKVLVAFDAGNMVEVAKHAKGNILICADNDHTKKINAGLVAARKTGLNFIYPMNTSGSDFNDMQKSQGIAAVTELIIKGKCPEVYRKSSKVPIPTILLDPPGMLKHISDYYNKTAIKHQPMFGVATGLIVGSVLFGRRYNTGGYGNFTSLYFVVAAVSGGGKDHLKNVVRSILKSGGLSHLERGGGFTAANTVIKSLQAQPLQLSFFEEFGQRILEASNGRANAKGVFRQMLDVWSSCHGSSKGEEYTNGTIPQVDNPALTMCGITTPETFLSSITEELVEQGFVNRILPFISHEERKASKLRKSISEVPIQIVEFITRNWLWENQDRPLDAEMNRCPDIEVDQVIFDFTDEAIEYLNEIEEIVIAKATKLDEQRTGDLVTRNRELVMRVSLIVAGMCEQEEITLENVKWSWTLVDYLYTQYMDDIKHSLASSDFEKDKLRALNALRKAGEDGIVIFDMPKKRPFSKWTKREREDILEELREAGLADTTKKKKGRKYFPSWIAIK